MSENTHASAGRCENADSDEAARVHRSDAARRSNLMAPTILS